MPRFLVALLCGAISGAATWWLTTDPGLSTVVALVVTVFVWLFGGIALLLIDD